jgi:hypothetical protein
LGNCENKKEEEISAQRNYKIRKFLAGEGDKIEHNKKTEYITCLKKIRITYKILLSEYKGKSPSLRQSSIRH